MQLTSATPLIVYVGCLAVYIILMVLLHKLFPKLPLLVRRFIAAILLVLLALAAILLTSPR